MKDWEYTLNKFSRLEFFFLLFIIFQPILDLLDYFQLPVSQPVRIIAMFIGFIYIWKYLHQREAKYAFIYLLILGLFMFSNLIDTILFKKPYSLFTEVVYDVKTYYFVMMLIVYLFVFRSISQKQDWQKIIQFITLIAMSIIGIIMLAATITGTGKRSYGFLQKQGHSGWFYSANELSAILAMGFGLALLYLIVSKRMISAKFALLPLIMLMIWSMQMIGTKVALGGAVLILGISFLVTFFYALFNKDRWTNPTILAFLLAATIFAVPFMPIGHNLTVHSPHVTLQNGANGKQLQDQSDEDLNGAIFSSRGAFFSQTVKSYKKAPISRKLLGLGYGGDYGKLPQLGIYKKVPKMIEMNFFDWFFNFGIIGFILLILPLIGLTLSIIKNLLTGRFKQVDLTMIIISAEAAIGLGVAFMAGHVLSSPASGIYLVIILSYFYALSQSTGVSENRI